MIRVRNNSICDTRSELCTANAQMCSGRGAKLTLGFSDIGEGMGR